MNMQTYFKIICFRQSRFKLSLLILLLIPFQNFGQDKFCSTLVYLDSVTEIQPYQLVFDKVKCIIATVGIESIMS